MGGLVFNFPVPRQSYELAFGRRFAEDLCEYGEPVYGYVYPGTNKAAARLRRALFLGKADTQNSYVLFDGQSIILSKSIRRISTTWRGHIWPTTFIASATPGNSNLDMVQGSFQQ